METKMNGLSREMIIHPGETLKEVLEDVSPITDHTGTLKMEFVDYSFDSKTKFNKTNKNTN